MSQAPDPNSHPFEQNPPDPNAVPRTSYGSPTSPSSQGPAPIYWPGAPYQQPGYGYPPPQAAPLPLGEAIQQLPNQYIKVLTKPSAATFAEEQGKAAWNIVWVQLLGLGILSGIFPVLLFELGMLRRPGSNAAFGAFLLRYALFDVIIVPLFFFVVSGIYYLIAKAFGGQGTFLAQSYSALLSYIPLSFLSVVLGLISLLNYVAGFAFLIYEIVLGIYMMMGVHRLSGGKATLAVLLPVMVLFLIGCGSLFILFILFSIGCSNGC